MYLFQLIHIFNNKLVRFQSLRRNFRYLLCDPVQSFTTIDQSAFLQQFCYLLYVLPNLVLFKVPKGVVAQMPVAAEVGSGDERDELGSG